MYTRLSNRYNAIVAVTAGELYGGQRRYILQCIDQLTEVLKCRLVNNLLGVRTLRFCFIQALSAFREF